MCSRPLLWRRASSESREGFAFDATDAAVWLLDAADTDGEGGADPPTPLATPGEAGCAGVSGRGDVDGSK